MTGTPGAFHFPAPPPLGLYVHLPWCLRKCPYCDFNSHPLRGALPEAAYVDALLQDLETELPLVWGRTVETLFIGGGTPSLLSPEELARLLSGIRARVPCRPGLEITLEANPGTVDQARFEGFRAAGVNRLSLGVQSFDDAALRRLGRIHDATEARGAIAAARRAGFERINIDLMFGLPGQALDQALADLEAAIAQDTGHLSWYQLTIEPNTAFAREPPSLPDADRLADMQEAGAERLAAAGLAAYEVSAWCRPGQACRHNLNYWRFGDYIGIGAGAHGKLTLAGEGRILRRRRRRHPRDYLAATDRLAGERSLTPADALFEYMLNALRLRAGFTPAAFEAATGLPWAMAEPRVARLVERGLLEQAGDGPSAVVRPSPRGRDLLDDLVASFLDGGE